MLQSAGAVRLRRSGAVSDIGAAAALCIGFVGALTSTWLCDDAFISFRYAENLVNGLGLVYNAGERVEGYTNFLWTLWIALGMTIGVGPEVWSALWGLAFYGGSLALLVAWHVRLRESFPSAPFALPLAALAGALHVDWNIYATSGLETSAYTFFVLAGYLLLSRSPLIPRRAAAAGAVLAIATLTRPDGVVFFAVGAAFVVWTGRPVVRSVAMFAGAYLLLYGPAVAWRVWYYGDYFPNTYYAKSAYLSWFDQGLFYVGLYFAKYWVLLAGFLLGMAVVLRRGREDRIFQEVALASAFVVAFSVYVARVGGDFMFARMLIPITPFLLILLEVGVTAIARARGPVYAVAAAIALAGTIFAPRVVGGSTFVRGIANEWEYYNVALPDHMGFLRSAGLILRKYFEGLPVRTAFTGAQAELVYYARPEVAVECETGLTDAFVARQPLAQRARVGHEKKATVPYMIDTRSLHFIWPFNPAGVAPFALDDWIPDVRIRFAPGVGARILHWDAALFRELENRGAAVDDFPGFLDAYVARLSGLPDEQVRKDYEKFRRFYFSHATDPVREGAFQRRLGILTSTAP